MGFGDDFTGPLMALPSSYVISDDQLLVSSFLHEAYATLEAEELTMGNLSNVQLNKDDTLVTLKMHVDNGSIIRELPQDACIASGTVPTFQPQAPNLDSSLEVVYGEALIMKSPVKVPESLQASVTIIQRTLVCQVLRFLLFVNHHLK